MVGIATDGASSMVGCTIYNTKNKGVAYYLLLHACPLVIDIHCSFHRVCLILVHA